MECGGACGARGHTQASGTMRGTMLSTMESTMRGTLGPESPPPSPGTAVSRRAKYIGSFSVDVDVLSRRSEAVRNHLNVLRAHYHSGQDVLLSISLSGITVSAPPAPLTLMEHGLKRISYATCDPSSCLFSFLARDPASPLRLQQCHTFRLPSPHQAEELNSIVGTAFRVAYAQQLAGEEETLPAPHRRPARGATAPRQPARGVTAGRLPSSRSAEDLLAGAGAGLETQGRGGTRSEPGEDGGPSYSVLDPGPCPPPGTLGTRDPGPCPPPGPPVARDPGPCPPAGRGLNRSCSGQAITACEVYSDVFQPLVRAPSEPPGHDSGLSSGSSSSQASGPGEEPGGAGEDLSAAPWYQAAMPRELAMSVLMKEPLGSFMVRNSHSQPGTLALSVRVPATFHPEGITHYIIVRLNSGYKIKGFLKQHPSLTSLITHHSVMPELLPVPLNIHRHNPAFPPDRDTDYAALQDFSQLMRDLRLGEQGAG